MNESARQPATGRLARARAVAERRLTPEEFAAALAVPIGEDERADVLSLVAWFRRRYPTPLERLAYVRRAYRRWAGTLARAGGGGQAT